MDMQSIFRDVVDDLDGSLGCILTDLETGLPLAVEYRDGTVMNDNTAGLLSHVGTQLFCGKLVHNFERSLSRDHAASSRFVREVQLTTGNTYQFMSTVPGWDQVIFILVTDRNVSLGMGLLAVHDAVRDLHRITQRVAEPSLDMTLRAPDEASEPSMPPPALLRQASRPESEHHGNSRVPDMENEPSPQQPGESLPRGFASSETRPARPAPENPAQQPAPPPVEEPAVPAVVEKPEAAEQLVEERPARSAPPAVMGPRARMFFKRSND